MNALYRPGPMDYIPDFIARKHGRQPHRHTTFPEMEKYSQGHLRRHCVPGTGHAPVATARPIHPRPERHPACKAMGKEAHRQDERAERPFLKGRTGQGHNPKVLEKIWTDWEKVRLLRLQQEPRHLPSWVAFQTAWLKANYPSEYMAAILPATAPTSTKSPASWTSASHEDLGARPGHQESCMEFGVNSPRRYPLRICGHQGRGRRWSRPK